MSTAAAFDTIATRYDELWTESPIGHAQRQLVWREVDPWFRPGERILDIGCGTGIDAAHYASRGLVVDAVDASPAMVDRARERGGFTASVLRAEELGALDGPYDGALSNFGALNCVSDLGGVAADLAGAIRPGGTLAICMIGRFCAWESVHYSIRGQFGKAMRRLGGTARSSLGITVHYPSISQLTAVFAPNFQLRRWMGIGLVIPPSYVRLSERTVRRLAPVDATLARLPVLRGAADHRLLLFVRK